MNTLEQLSFLYPNAVTVGVILIALLVIYLAGKALAWVFSSTEKKIEPEPSVLTELDELRRSNEKLSTRYDQLAYDYDVLGHEYGKYKTNVELFYVKKDNIRAESDNRIAELEKELSNLRSSCDDSFLNTVDRANKLSLKCASLENTIAEFDVYKKDAQEVHDRILKLYEAEVSAKKELSTKLWHSRREVTKLNRDLISATIQIKELGDKYSSAERERGEYESMYNSVLAQYAELKVKLNAIEHPKSETDVSDLSWAKWVAADKCGAICAFRLTPKKMDEIWVDNNNYREIAYLTPEQAIALCGRIPSWSDDEPTPVIGKASEPE